MPIPHSNTLHDKIESHRNVTDEFIHDESCSLVHIPSLPPPFMLCHFKFFDILSETTYNLDYKFVGLLYDQEK